MNTDRKKLFAAKLEKAALASQLAGTYKALGFLEEGDRWGSLAKFEREDALDLLQDSQDDSPAFPLYLADYGNAYCCSYNEEPDECPTSKDSDREEVVRAAFFEGAPLPTTSEEDEPKPPRPSLTDLGRGDTIRVFRETFFGGDRTSEAGVIYRRDGADEGAQPWRQDPLGVSNLVPYINSEDIREWELEQRNPTPVLGELGEGSRIRVFQENAYGETRSSEEGAIYRHDGNDEDYRPWCRVTSHESEDPLAPYLNSSDIIEWRAA